MEKFDNILMETRDSTFEERPIRRFRLFVDTVDTRVTICDGYGNLSEHFLPSDKAEAYFKLFAAAPLLLSALIKAVQHQDAIEAITKLENKTYTKLPWHIEAKAALTAAGVTVKTVEDDHA